MNRCKVFKTFFAFFALFAFFARIVDAAVPEQTRLLAPIVSYQGMVIGRENPPTGVVESVDGGLNWQSLTWPELMAGSVAVDESGRWVYLACGNGVMVSEDGGRHWRLTGGWEMMECQRVWIDTANPARAWAATPYGVYRAENILAPGNPWVKISERMYCSDVIQDRTNPDVVWVGTHRGVVGSKDGGKTFQRVGPDVPVRRIVQHRTNPNQYWALSEGMGVLETVDGGRYWRKVFGSPKVTYCLAQSSFDDKHLIVGSMDGTYTTRDGGVTWTLKGTGFAPLHLVYGLAMDPYDGSKLWAGSRGGLYASQDAGLTWKLTALTGANLQDVWCGPRRAVPERPLSSQPGALSIAASSLPAVKPRADPPGYRDRVRAMQGYFLNLPINLTAAKVDFFHAGAYAQSGKGDEKLWEICARSLEKPGHSMFHSFPAMVGYAMAKDRMPEPLKAKFRDFFTKNSFYRGDTENHWVMHYAVMLLSAEEWPETPASQWYTGRTTQDMHDEAKGWLKHWARLTATKGQGEFDSPVYMFMYVAPMSLLYEYARDPEIKRLAGMMLDLLLADYLVESLEGAYTGGHSRSYPSDVTQGSLNTVSAYHYLAAGGIPLPKGIHGWLIPLVYSGYRPPALFEAMGNRRERPAVHTEVKRVRNVMRFGPELNPPVYKYNYSTPRYVLGSMQGGVLQPIQQHTWDVTWTSQAKNPVMFAVHPYYSGYELGMFFPGDLPGLVEAVTGQRSDYTSPDKWVSSSPYEKVFQRENTLMALYQIPMDADHRHLNLHFPKCLQKTEEGGWVFGQDGGVYVAFYAFQPGEWTEFPDHWRFRCQGDRAGFVVKVGASPLTFEAFKAQIVKSRPPQLSGEGESLRMTYAEDAGTSFAFDWRDGRATLNGKEVSFPKDKLFDGPFMKSQVGSGVIRMTDGQSTVTLDFNANTVIE